MPTTKLKNKIAPIVSNSNGVNSNCFGLLGLVALGAVSNSNGVNSNSFFYFLGYITIVVSNSNGVNSNLVLRRF